MLTSRAEIIPCSDIHLHSNNGNGSSFFNNYGSLENAILFRGDATHTTTKKFRGKSTIQTKGMINSFQQITLSSQKTQPTQQ